MTTKSTLLSVFIIALTGTLELCAQVPNGGFENWTSGNPDSWLVNNVVGFGVPVTQVTPSYSGSYALK